MSEPASGGATLYPAVRAIVDSWRLILVFVVVMTVTAGAVEIHRGALVLWRATAVVSITADAKELATQILTARLMSGDIARALGLGPHTTVRVRGGPVMYVDAVAPTAAEAIATANRIVDIAIHEAEQAADADRRDYLRAVEAYERRRAEHRVAIDVEVGRIERRLAALAAAQAQESALPAGAGLRAGDGPIIVGATPGERRAERQEAERAQLETRLSHLRTPEGVGTPPAPPAHAGRRAERLDRAVSATRMPSHSLYVLWIAGLTGLTLACGAVLIRRWWVESGQRYAKED